MVKKAQITAFVIIGIIVLVIAGIFLFKLKPGNETKTQTTEVALSSNEEVKSYVQKCLETSVLKAIDILGMREESDQLSSFIGLSVLVCTENFKTYRDAGYEVDYKVPKVHVRFDEERIGVQMIFPVTLKKGGNQINLERFQYELPKSAFLRNLNGFANSDKTLFSQDKNAIIEIKKGTSIKDSQSNPVDTLQVKVIDKHIDGAENDVVLNSVVYQGEPTGTQFSPPLEFKIQIKKEDLPSNYLVTSPKIGWFSPETGLWRTYPTCGFEETDTHYVYCGLVDHFTPVALLGCGNSDQGENVILFSMFGANRDEPLGSNIPYKEIIEPAIKEMWVTNPLSDQSNFLIPELNNIAFCDIKENRYYDVMRKYSSDHLSSLCDIGRDDLLFRDWDRDDLKENNRVDAYSYSFNVGDSNTPYQSGDSTLQTNCYNSCKFKAESSLRCYFNGDCANAGDIEPIDSSLRFDPFNLIKDEKQEKIISGDGLTDGIQLSCHFDETLNQKTNKWEIQENTATCSLDDALNNLKNKAQLPDTDTTLLDYYKKVYSTDELESIPATAKLVKETMVQRGAFFASPKSFGYETILGEPNDVNGQGYFVFNIEPDTCIDGYQNTDPNFIEASIFNFEGKQIVSFLSSEVYSLNDDDKSCSPNDKCKWSLNFALDKKPVDAPNNEFRLYDELRKKEEKAIPSTEVYGKLRIGTNLIGVSLENKEDISAYAKGILQLKGVINHDPHRPEAVIDAENFNQIKIYDSDEEDVDDIIDTMLYSCMTGGALGGGGGLAFFGIGALPGAAIGCLIGVGLTGVVYIPSVHTENDNAVIGDNCNGNTDCLSGRCDGFRCKEKEANGGDCNEDNDCESDECDWFVCVENTG